MKTGYIIHKVFDMHLSPRITQKRQTYNFIVVLEVNKNLPFIYRKIQVQDLKLHIMNHVRVVIFQKQHVLRKQPY